MPPVIHDSDDDEKYSEADSSVVGLNQEEEAGEQYNNLNYANDQDSDLSSVLSDDNEADENQGEGEGDEEDDGEAGEDEQASSDLDDVEDDAKAADEGEEDDEEEEEEEDDDDLDELEEEEEEEEEEIPSISDDEDAYKLEDPDEIDDDLELRDEEEDDLPKLVSPAKVGHRTSSRLKQESYPQTTRETRKRQLTLYDEEDDEEEFNEAPRRLKPTRKSRRGPEPELQPQDLDADLILTDEEAEYNPRANPDLSKMTERQRSRYLEEEADSKKEFLELDETMTNPKKTKPKKTETEQQIAVRKAESARRRQDYKMKVLEEEKRDTLNKLLKRRATKTREVADKEGSVDVVKLALKQRRPTLEHPALYRWVSNTTTLQGNSTLRFPAPS